MRGYRKLVYFFGMKKERFMSRAGRCIVERRNFEAINYDPAIVAKTK